MKLSKSIGIGLVVLAIQLSASADEIAVLRNGFTIRCERKQQTGATTRLYTRGGFMDVPTAEIVSFEPDDMADVNPEPSATMAAAAQPAAQPTTNLPPASASSSSGVPATVAPVAAAPSGRATPPSRASLDQMVRDASTRHQLDPDFVNSVIKAESNFQIRAVSSKGAQGLMQLMPGTASLLGVLDPFDPQANVEGGTAYLSQLLDLYHNDPIKALAAYNAGSHRVDQYHGVPPYMETQAYVARIVRDYNAKKRAEMKAQASAPASAKATKKPAKTPQPQKPD
jgi:soluble lytic murein transglycosylase-like protein